MDNFPVYQTALFLHILGALGFFIALGVFYASVLGVRRAQTVGSIKLWTGAAAGVSRILFPISFLVIVIAGIYMVRVSLRALVASVSALASTGGGTVGGTAGASVGGAVEPSA